MGLALNANRSDQVVVLAGIGLNALFGWWWADPVAALGISLLLVREGLEAWNSEDHDA